jgi:hypothetical protein
MQETPERYAVIDLQGLTALSGFCRKWAIFKERVANG